MGKKINRSLLLITVALLSVEQALAYIDPGTGGMIIGSIWPFIVAVFAAIGGFFLKFFRPIKTGVASTWKKIRKKEESQEKEE